MILSNQTTACILIIIVIIAFPADSPFAIPASIREGFFDVFHSTLNEPPSVHKPERQWSVPQNLDKSDISKILRDVIGSLLCATGMRRPRKT